MKHLINDGNASLKTGHTERHEPHYRDYDGHPFIKKAIEAVSEDGTLYGVHVYLMLDEDGQPDGVYFDSEPRAGDSAVLGNVGPGNDRALRRNGFRTARKTDRRFTENRSEWAVAAVGHEVLGDRLPSDLEAPKTVV